MPGAEGVARAEPLKLVKPHPATEVDPTVGNMLPLVEERIWTCRYEGFATARMFGRTNKIVLSFRIAETGGFLETPLRAYFNATRLIGNVGRSGRFDVSQTSDFFRTFVSLFGLPPDRRTDRLPMSRFHGKAFKCLVETVKQSRNQKAIPELARYSVIREIVEEYRGE